MNSSPLTGNRYSSMQLNLDTRDKGMVVMISWIENIQFRFKLDKDMNDILLEHGYDPDTYYFGVPFMWPSQSDLLFTSLTDFKAGLLYQIAKDDKNTSCHLTTESCVKMPDVFNLVQDTLQNLFNIFTAYVPILLLIFPHNKVLQTLNSYPLLFSVILPSLLCAFFLLFTLPILLLAIQFVRRKKLGQSEYINRDSVDDSLIFRDHCNCSDKNTGYKKNRRKVGKPDEKKYLVCKNLSLGILLLIMVFIYPFSIKITKSILESKLQDAVSKYKADVSRWLVIFYKYLSIFFFDSKFGNNLSSCSITSNPLKTGFWFYFGAGNIDYGDKFLEQLFDNQKEKIDVFSTRLATSSLTISFTTLFHLISIYLMMQGKVFKTIGDHWRTGLKKRRVAILMLILLCLVINISRYFMCLKDSNIWLSFLQRLAMVTICTPTSIVLEWVCLRLYYSYLSRLQLSILEFLLVWRHRKDSVLSSYLARGYLSVMELSKWKVSVRRYTTVIQSLLEEQTGHKFLAIDTGSIVERFGLPLAINRKGGDFIQTDHDVMFVPTDTVVSLQGGSLGLVTIEGLDEYFHLQSFNKQCRLLNSDNDSFIDNQKDKILIKEIVTNMPIKDLAPKSVDDRKTLLGLACINFTQRIFSWDQVRTTEVGPAINFRVITSHLDHSLAKHDEWLKRIDCDFILAFHLDHWPEVATSWITRTRCWPKQEVISKIVRIGCEVVPKKRADMDNRAWRLSFSMAEHTLACSVGNKARKTYLAVKLFAKKKLQSVCPFLKSYHIKTIFFHYMETKTHEYWDDTEIESTIKDLLG